MSATQTTAGATPIVPAHLANTFAALSASEPFERVEGAVSQSLEAAEGARALQEGYVCATFEKAAAGGPMVLTADPAADVRSRNLHTLLVRNKTGARAEHVDYVLLPELCAPRDALFYQARLLCNNNSLWAAELAPLRALLDGELRNQKAFRRDWKLADVDGTPTHFKEMAGGAIKVFMHVSPVTHNPSGADKSGVQLLRAATSVSHAMECLDVPEHLTLFQFDHAEEPLTIRLLSTPCSPHGKHLHDLASDVYAEGMPTKTRQNTPTVLAVLCTGIQHDALLANPPGTTKAVAAEYATALVHPRFGVHETVAAQLAVPHLLKAAQSIGEVHFMTQIGKAILRTRPEKDSEVSALTVEQKGAHLKDELKLCSYWKSIHDSLDASEKACLDLGIQRMHEKQPITFKPITATLASAPSPVFADVDKTCGAKSLHHIELTVRIKGALTVPCGMLKRDAKTLNVRIDNNWVLESHLLCLP